MSAKLLLAFQEGLCCVELVLSEMMFRCTGSNLLACERIKDKSHC